MATQTEHYNFDLREGSDIFNPLSSNTNFVSLDTLLWNLQQTGGISVYSNSVTNSQLLLSDAPVANNTIFKFVAADDANQFSYPGAGSVANIIGLDGNVFTVKQGSLYVAWLNGSGNMVVIAWPELINAQQFDGQPASYYATQQELLSINTTANNAVATAQAAATVANNALDKAENAGPIITTLWTNPNPTSSISTLGITFDPIPDTTKFLIVECRSTTTNDSQRFTAVAYYLKDYVTNGGHLAIPLAYTANATRIFNILSTTTANITANTDNTTNVPASSIPVALYAVS